MPNLMKIFSLHRRRLGRPGVIGAVLLCLLIVPSVAVAAHRVVVWNLRSRYVTKAEAFTGLTPSIAKTAGPTGLRSWVVLPDGYTPTKCWPVLYLLHSSGIVNQWLGAAALYQNLPAIVVIPGGGNGQYTNWWNGGARTPAWESWFFDELMPKVNRTFSVCTDRRSHAIAGASMGGFGAFYLASQRPDYFGTAASFSGVIAITDPIIEFGFSGYDPVWGAPGSFYALGHDPVHLLPNLAHTRLMVEVGNGTPLGPQDTDPGNAKLIESAMAREAADFVAAAHHTHIPVTFSQHDGIHTTANFNYDLTQLLSWNPFGAVTSSPSSWSFTTTETSGTAWGYQFTFAQPPATLERFGYSRGRLSVTGEGRVTLTSPTGHRVSSTLPFTLRNGVIRHSRSPQSDRQKSPALPVVMTVGPNNPPHRKPFTVRFRTTRSLAAGQTYRLIARQSLSRCIVDSFTQVAARKKGEIVTAVMRPGTGLGHPRNQWCVGDGLVELTIVSRNASSFQVGDLIGQVPFKTR